MKRNKPVPPQIRPDPMQAASMTECTGILPAQIETDDEGESIAALQSIPPVIAPHGKDKR